MLSTHLVSLIKLLGISIIFILKFNFSSFYIDEFARYFFGFLMLPWLFISFNSKGFNFFYGFYRIMRAVVYINLVLVVLGLIFKINLFETYEFSRFGYNGALISQGSTPYIYLTATALFWVYRDKMLLFLTMFLVLISGIKGAYLIAGLFFILLIATNAEMQLLKKVKIIFIIFVAFIVSLSIIYTQNSFKEVIEETSFISSLFSYRLENTIELWAKISPHNYNILIGSLKLHTLRLELQAVDVLLFLGSSGFVLISFYFYKIYKLLVFDNVSRSFFLSVIGLAVLSGNLLYIPMVCFVFYAFLILYKQHSLRIR